MKINLIIIVMALSTFLLASDKKVDDNSNAQKEISQKEYEIYQQAEKLSLSQKSLKAIKYIDTFEKESGEQLHPALLALRAKLRIDLSDFKNALIDFKQAYLLDPSEQLQLNIALCYNQLQDPYMSEAVLKQGLLKAKDPYPFKRGLLEATLAQQKYDESLSLLQSLKKERPDDTKLLMLEAQLLWQTNKPKEAYIKLKLLQKIEPAPQKQTLSMLIDLALHLNLTQEADALIQSSLMLNQNNDRKIKVLISQYIQIEKFEIALIWLSKLNPESSPDVFLFTAEALVTSQPNKSIELLQKIKKKESANGRYHYIIGLTNSELKNYDLAIAQFHIAKSFEDYQTPSLWQLLKIYQLNDDKPNCIKTLQELEHIEPNNKTVKQLINYYE